MAGQSCAAVDPRCYGPGLRLVRRGKALLMLMELCHNVHQLVTGLGHDWLMERLRI